MESFVELFYDGLIILIVLLAFLSFFVSALIFFKPDKAALLNAMFNKNFSTKGLSRQLEHEVKTADFLIKYRYWVGIPFFFGALYTIYYLIFSFDQNRFITFVVKPSNQTAELFTLMFMDVVQWLIAIWCLVGAVLCVILAFMPNLFKKISQTLDAFFSTEKVQDLIDTSHNSIDQWVLKNHIMVGFFLFMGSCFLVIFCLKVFYL